MDHWIHKFSETPFGCKFTPLNGRKMIYKFFIFLLGIVLLPLILTLGPILMGLFYGIYAGSYCCIGIQRSYISSCLCKLILYLFAIPGFFITVGLATAIGCLAAGIGALLTVPLEIVHFCIFFRSVYWWNKTRKHDNEGAEDSSKKKKNHLQIEMIEP